MRKKIVGLFLGLIVLLFIIGLILIFSNSKKISDSELFKSEYNNVKADNIFVYKNVQEIIKILENGTGIIYLGFPECKWCQAYVPYLNDVAKENGIEKIYYFNIKEERENNTRNYQRIVNLTSKYLEKDENGEKRVYVPDVYVVLDGKIVGHNNETSDITKDITPEEYWTEDKVTEFKNELVKMISPLVSKSCTACN